MKIQKHQKLHAFLGGIALIATIFFGVGILIQQKMAAFAANTDDLAGKTALIDGDSIAAGMYSYHSILSSTYGMETTKIAYGGARFYYPDAPANCADGTSSCNVIPAHITDEIYATDYDYLILEGGINDAMNNYVQEPGQYLIAMRSYFERITSNPLWADAKIGFVIIPRTKKVPSREASMWKEVMALCDEFGIEYINFFKTSEDDDYVVPAGFDYNILQTVYGSYSSQQVGSVDGLHPTAGGHKVIAGYIANWMAELPQYKYTVSFGGLAQSQSVLHGQPATAPESPQDPSRVFNHWSTSTTCETSYDFNTPVNSDLTLHACWAEDTPSTPVTYTLTVNHRSADGQTLAPTQTTLLEAGSSYSASPANTLLAMYNYTVDKPISGTITSNLTITFIYTKKIATINVWYVDESGDNIATPETFEVEFGTTYTADDKQSELPSYTLISRSDNYTGEAKSTPINVTFTYARKPADLNASVQITSDNAIINNDSQKVSYDIKFNATSVNYDGEVTIQIVSQLPYAINPDTSNLDGGTYNKNAKTVTWNINTIADMPSEQSYNITKQPTLQYINVPATDRSAINQVTATITLGDEKTAHAQSSTSSTVAFSGTIRVRYLLASTGASLAQDLVLTGLVGDPVIVATREFNGYRLVQDVSGKYQYTVANQTLTFKYEKINDEPSGPTNPDTPEEPDTPDTPDTPDNPDVPDTPDTPDTPDNPDTPEGPDTPDTPDNPDTPDTPDNPDVPDTPDSPGAPDTPEDPNAPSSPNDHESNTPTTNTPEGGTTGSISTPDTGANTKNTDDGLFPIEIIPPISALVIAILVYMLKNRKDHIKFD